MGLTFGGALGANMYGCVFMTFGGALGANMYGCVLVTDLDEVGQHGGGGELEVVDLLAAPERHPDEEDGRPQYVGAARRQQVPAPQREGVTHRDLAILDATERNREREGRETERETDRERKMENMCKKRLCHSQRES